MLTTQGWAGEGLAPHSGAPRGDLGRNPAPYSRGIGGTICCGLFGGQRGPGSGQNTRAGALHKASGVDAGGEQGPEVGVWPVGPSAPVFSMPALQLLLVVGLTVGASLPLELGSHPGVCPNQLSPSLWVDAQSTCERECVRDQDCAGAERCCTNVCGLRSCVAARFPEGDGGPEAPGLVASCEGFACAQQGSDCDIWAGQPVCRCRDRCEKEPHFTCASDGLTYYNRCYMDAEACLRGLRLQVVSCKHVLSWPPPSSPGPPEATAQPTPADSPVPPALYSSPAPQAVHVGGTASLHCDVSGHPAPAVTWEKQSDQRESLIMRPDQMYGNMVVTSIGQLVLYNARPEDAGLYTCTARNAAGLLRADFPLSVVSREAPRAPEPASACQPNPQACTGPPSGRVLWHYDLQRGGCMTFQARSCDVGFQTYDACQRACARGPGDACELPPVQGPCQGWEPRWAYSPLLQHCHPFIFGGCDGNANNFESRESCEDACPVPRAPPCRACRLRSKLALSLCRSDFAIVGRVTELLEEPEAGGGIARVTLDDVLKDDKMGLRFLGTKYLEVTLRGMDWACPCPNVTVGDGPLVIMGDVRDGVAVLDAGSYVRSASEKRVKKISELLEKKACALLNRFQD
ncbi:WAP, Kazal, immunoglobulin, Kunitz and NTR domain-containing protein 1 [Sorex araneus]|uniref:WAP, Kazal, immunoglobulin, Kunitz and NTR domain-containing protein 1 n=1 Tax=Sorex araneus TaxID=42254 RepID=UPI002433CAA8|nr:WAP, Kazal, immunoglobulin, Kunitz and NTR domain-containing protein 1 [Sorex araneus]